MKPLKAMTPCATLLREPESLPGTENKVLVLERNAALLPYHNFAKGQSGGTLLQMRTAHISVNVQTMRQKSSYVKCVVDVTCRICHVLTAAHPAVMIPRDMTMLSPSFARLEIWMWRKRTSG